MCAAQAVERVSPILAIFENVKGVSMQLSKNGIKHRRAIDIVTEDANELGYHFVAWLSHRDVCNATVYV